MFLRISEPVIYGSLVLWAWALFILFLLTLFPLFETKMNLWAWNPNRSSKHRRSWVSLDPPPPTWPGGQAIRWNYFICIFHTLSRSTGGGGCHRKAGGFSGLNTKPFIDITKSTRSTLKRYHIKNPKWIHSVATIFKNFKKCRILNWGFTLVVA